MELKPAGGTAAAPAVSLLLVAHSGAAASGADQPAAAEAGTGAEPQRVSVSLVMGGPADTPLPGASASPRAPPKQQKAGGLQPWPLPGGPLVPGFSRLRSLRSGMQQLLPAVSRRWRGGAGKRASLPMRPLGRRGRGGSRACGPAPGGVAGAPQPLSVLEDGGWRMEVCVMPRNAQCMHACSVACACAVSPPDGLDVLAPALRRVSRYQQGAPGRGEGHMQDCMRHAATSRRRHRRRPAGGISSSRLQSRTPALCRTWLIS